MAETDPEIKNPNTSRYLTEEEPNLFNWLMYKRINKKF